MTINPRDILFMAGGACLTKYGTPSRRTAPISRGGEDVQETFTRAAPNAFYTDRDGVLRQATTNVPRFTYLDPLSSGTRSPYWLMEDTRTNICLQSQTLGTTWATTRSSVSANADTAPDGTTTADRLVEDGTATNTHFITQGSLTITADTPNAVSIYAKAGTRGFLRLTFGDATSTNLYRCFFNITTGAVMASSVVGAGVFTSAVTESLGSGWYRILMTGSVNGGVTTGQIRVDMSSNGTSNSYSGDGVSYISLWGAQVEDNAKFASSYIPTTTVAVTRAAEVCSFPYYGDTSETITLYTRFVERGTIAQGSGYLMLIGGGTPQIALAVVSPSSFYQLFTTGFNASGSVLSNTTAPTYGQLVELRGVFNPTTGTHQIHQSINEAAEVSAVAVALTPITPATPWGVSTIRLQFNALWGVAALDTAAVVRGTATLADLRTMRA